MRELAFGNSVVEYEYSDHIGTVSLNRPTSLNALNSEIVHAVRDALAQSIQDHCRCVILQGRGRAFSAGHDLSVDDSDSTPNDKAIELQSLQDVTRTIRQSPCPVIASVHGYALGAGAEFALTCDLIVASESAKFGFPEVSVGLGVTGGISHILPAIVGPQKAKEILFLSEQITAVEAQRLGLVNYVVPDPELAQRSRSLAQTLASKPATAITAAKKCLDSGPESGIDAAFNREIMFGVGLNGNPDAIRAADEFRQAHGGPH